MKANRIPIAIEPAISSQGFRGAAAIGPSVTGGWFPSARGGAADFVSPATGGGVFPFAALGGADGAADFVAGAKPRAPLPMQWLGLEWLFRCLWEPRRRWKRTLRMFRMPLYALFPHGW